MGYTDISFSKRWLLLDDLEGEVWADIRDYEGIYKVSNYGRIKSLKRTVRYYSYTKEIPSQIIRPNITGKDGKYYFAIHLRKDEKRKSVKIHRLVALSFIENPNNYPCINHKNEDKFDNRAENLEWCSYSYNNTYNNLKERMHNKKINVPSISYPVFQYDCEGNFIAEYPSYSEAGRQTGIPPSTIRSFCER